MRIVEWIQIVVGLFAIGTGAIVVRGVLKITLSSSVVIRFLDCSLIASVAGLLPLSRHLSTIQGICMGSVYCAAVVFLAWHRFHLAGVWRPVFAFALVAVLYLNVVSLSFRLLQHSALSSAAAVGAGIHPGVVQLFITLAFAPLGALAVQRCHAQRTSDARHTRFLFVKR